MTALLALAALAALLGFALAWRARAPQPAAPEDIERRAARAQLAALGADPLLDARVREDEAARLARELAEPAPGPAPSPAPSGTPPRRVGALTAAVVAGLVALLSGGIYLATRTPAPPAPPAAEVPPQVAAMVSRLEERLAREGGSAADWQRLGRSYAVLGRIREAQQAYARAAQLDPDDVMILDGYAALGTPPPPPAPIAAMLQRFEAAAHAAPQDPRAWARLGFARSRLGDPAGARDAYARAYALDPRPELLAAYAAAEYALSPERPSAQAVALYEELLARQPDDPVALWVLGLAALQAGEREHAGALLDRLAAALPEDAPMRSVVEELRARARAAR